MHDGTLVLSTQYCRKTETFAVDIPGIDFEQVFVMPADIAANWSEHITETLAKPLPPPPVSKLHTIQMSDDAVPTIKLSGQLLCIHGQGHNFGLIVVLDGDELAALKERLDGNIDEGDSYPPKPYLLKYLPAKGTA